MKGDKERERSIIRKRCRGALAAACVAAVAFVAAAPASASHLQPGMSIQVGNSVKLVNHVYLVVPVVITCPVISLEPNQIIEGETVNVSVQEKVAGGTLTTGGTSFGYSNETTFGGGISGTLLTCDGSPHTYYANVFPTIDSTTGLGVAFKSGKAVASASLDIFLRDQVTIAGDDNAVSSGLTSISIRG
jgi:hypothetical protein